MVVMGWEADIPDSGIAFGFGEVGRAVAEPVAAEEVQVFIEVGVFLDRIGDGAESAQHIPLVGHEAGDAAAAHAGGVGDIEADDGLGLAGEGVDDLGAGFSGPGVGVPNGDGGGGRAIEFMEDLDDLHGALAMADEEGAEAFLFVVEGDGAGDHVAAFVAADGVGAVVGIGETCCGVAHGSEEVGEGDHARDDEPHAAVDEEDARGGCMGEDVMDIRGSDVVGVELEDLFLEFGGEGAGGVRELGGEELGGIRGCAMARVGAAAAEQQREQGERGRGDGGVWVQRPWWSSWIVFCRLTFTCLRAFASNTLLLEVRQAWSDWLAVVADRTRGVAGPVETARK